MAVSGNSRRDWLAPSEGSRPNPRTEYRTAYRNIRKGPPAGPHGKTLPRLPTRKPRSALALPGPGQTIAARTERALPWFEHLGLTPAPEAHDAGRDRHRVQGLESSLNPIELSELAKREGESMLTILIGMRQEMAAIKNTAIQSGQLSVAIAAHAAQRADLQLIGSLIAPFLASRFTAADVTNDVRRVERIIIEPVRPGEFVDPDTGTVQRKPDRGTTSSVIALIPIPSPSAVHASTTIRSRAPTTLRFSAAKAALSEARTRDLVQTHVRKGPSHDCRRLRTPHPLLACLEEPRRHGRASTTCSRTRCQ